MHRRPRLTLIVTVRPVQGRTLGVRAQSSGDIPERWRRRGVWREQLEPLAPNQLALDDAVDFEVFDRRRVSAEACFVTGGGDLLAPGLGLFARVPDFNDPDFAVSPRAGPPRSA